VDRGAELQLLYGLLDRPWWDVVAGVARNFKPGVPQDLAAFRYPGHGALNAFEAGSHGPSSARMAKLPARLEASTSILLNSTADLQPNCRNEPTARNDLSECGVLGGKYRARLASSALRDVRQPFCPPIIGVSWSPPPMEHGRHVRDEGRDVDERVLSPRNLDVV